MNAAAMRAGRERQLDELYEKQARDHANFNVWLAMERQAFTNRAMIAEDFGRDSGEFADADAEWLKVIRLMPTAPPDSAACWRS